MVKSEMCCFNLVFDFLDSYWGAIVASASLTVAAVTLYCAHWKPFTPRTYCTGRYVLSINIKNPVQIAIGLTLNFANDGAKAGTVENLFLKIRNQQINELYIPLMDVTKNELNLRAEPNFDGYRAKSFVGFEIPAKTVIPKALSFIPSNTSFVLPQGRYFVDLYTKTSKNEEYAKVDSVEIEYDQADADTIQPQSIPTGTFVIAKFQEKVVKKLEEQLNKIATERE